MGKLRRLLLPLLLTGALLLGGRSARAETAASLATAVAQAQPGDTIFVDGGVYRGNLVIDKPLTLLGENHPVIDGGGAGTVVKITAAGTTLQGFTIRNSGSSLDEENAGVAVEASDVVIRDNRFEDTLFGIYLRKAHGSVVRGNVVHSKALDVPRRGDAIRVWYSRDVLIENNVVDRARDVVLWYSERLTVRGNEVRNGRYGLHFMYCDDATIADNRLLHNSVGAFLMYSRRLYMTHNTVAYNRGPSGYGVGLKDLDDAVVVENLFLDNRVGAYVDGSPREVDSIGRFQGNVFAYNDVGVELLPAVRHNEFAGNSFVENEEQVAIAGGGTPGENAWTVDGRGNYWSDYAGYDADEDGLGDMVYRSERLFENLMRQAPALRLFLYSPITTALDFAARAFPAVKPQPKLVDERPLTVPQVPTEAPPLPQPENGGWPGVAAVLLALALGLAALPRLHRRYHFGA